MERVERNGAKHSMCLQSVYYKHNTNYHLCVCFSMSDVCMVVLYMQKTYSCQY